MFSLACKAALRARLLIAFLVPVTTLAGNNWPEHRGNLIGAPLTLAGGTLSGPLFQNSTFSSNFTSPLLGWDRRTLSIGDLTTDTAATTFRIMSQSIYSGAAANFNGGVLYLGGGYGRKKAAMTAANCVGDTVTYEDDNFSYFTCTENGTTVAGVSFDCNGETNAVCATNLATCMNGFNGITVTANSPTSGTVYWQRDQSDPASIIAGIVPSDHTCAAVTANHDGGVNLYGPLTIARADQVWNTNATLNTIFAGLESYYLPDGQTITNSKQFDFEANSFFGVAGGGVETVTNPVTFYISGAPSGTNITFTNGPYALWVDAGKTRLDGTVVTGAAVGGTEQVGAVFPGSVTQASLSGAATNGQIVYCSDCTIANPCAGAGTGAIAKRLNGVWVCN